MVNFFRQINVHNGFGISWEPTLATKTFLSSGEIRWVRKGDILYVISPHLSTSRIKWAA